MAERKHLFGSSESSDFILNMTEQGTKKLCGLYCIIAMLAITLAAVPYYFTKNIVDHVDNVGGMENVHYLSEKTIYWVSTLMIGMGIIGYCIFLIGRMKEEVSLKYNKSLIWLAAIILMSIISALLSKNLEYAFTGYFDRAEGMLSILGYFGFFAAAMTVTGDDWRRRVCDVLVCIGAFNAVAGILQSIPATGEKFPSWFAYLYGRLGSDVGEGEVVINNIIHTKDYTANGFMCTPFALAALLTISFAAAFSGTVFDKSRLRKSLYILSGLLMAVCAVFTDVFPAILGIGCSAIFVMVCAVVYKIRSEDAEDKTSGKAAVVTALCGLVAVGAVFGVMYAAGQLGLKDEQVIFTDCYDRLSIGQGFREDTSQWIYPYLWDDGLYAVQNYPVLGTGPDNWGTMYDLGLIIDRSYNEYIDIAMQRGIITLALYVIFIIITLKKGFSAVGSFFKGEHGWAAAAVLCGASAYMVQAFFNISSISGSPYFWVAAGLIWSFTAKRPTKGK